MKLAKISVDGVLKIIFWICRSYVEWYWRFADLPYPDDLNAWIRPTQADIDRWHELRDFEV